MASEVFRANVGIALVKDGNILVFERADVPGVWQLPQGGIHQGETSHQAAYRELLEETGLDDSSVRLLGEHPDWLVYELPDELKDGRFLGQVQRWFVFELLVDVTDIDLSGDGHQEFTSYRWVPYDSLVDIATPFRQPVYSQVVSYAKTL